MNEQNTKTRPKPVLLCILDGWGHRDDDSHNAISLADTPNWDGFMQNSPHSLLATSGEDVGLPAGQMGNSEVGHMNIGSGRIVMQGLPKIDAAIKDGSLAQKKELENFMAKLSEAKGTCHLMGLISDGGVHAHIKHVIALAKILDAQKIPVAIHVFTDGRDTPPESAIGYVENLLKEISGLNGVSIATIAGRYYAMDRDNRWERVEKAYNAIVTADGAEAEEPVQAVRESYAQGKGDEFLLPVVLGGYEGMTDGDGVLMANFRSDRVRQILSALLNPGFSGFERGKTVKVAAALGMAEYSDELNAFMENLFPPEKLKKILGEVIAAAGLSQLRIAETEKYAHVTFFFNGGREEEFTGEERILVPSPKVATYDMQPEMSAQEVTEKLLEAIISDKFDLIVVNYANTDMVGHTGLEEAAKKAVEAVDEALGKLHKAIVGKGGAMIITADHGNAEMMVDPKTNEPHTAHTTGPVPCVILGAGNDLSLKNGRLSDVAPTILALMQLSQPTEMTGESLIA